MYNDDTPEVHVEVCGQTELTSAQCKVMAVSPYFY